MHAGLLDFFVLEASECTERLDALLGSPWDDELEPYREAGEGAAVTWLHQVV